MRPVENQLSDDEPWLSNHDGLTKNLNATRHNWLLHIALFIATCISTYMVGCWMSGYSVDLTFQPTGFMYSASIMGILVVHEMGHFIAARKHKVDASLPYFIPAPFPPIGTLGAFIRMRKPPRALKCMADIGYAGPLAGVVVAVGLCFIGLTLSEVKPIVDLSPDSLVEGNSILYWALKKITHPEMGPHEDVLLHPIAWAGWLGLLVTSLNLLPVGQLDGGHVMYVLLGSRKHQIIGRIVHICVFVMGFLGLACMLALSYDPTYNYLDNAGLIYATHRATGMLPWILWALLLKFVGGRHPAVEDPGTSLGPGRIALCIASMTIFVLTFIPVFVSTAKP